MLEEKGKENEAEKKAGEEVIKVPVAKKEAELSPLDEARGMFEDFDRRLTRLFGYHWPFPIRERRLFRPEAFISLDIEDTGNALVVTAEVPGMPKEQIEVSIDGRMLTMKGEKKKEEEEKSRTFYRKETSFKCERTVELPVDIKAEEAEGNLKDGILTITLPKVKPTKVTKVSVK